MIDGRNKVKLLVIVASVGFLAVVGLALYQWLHVDYTNMVVVTNLETCAERMTKETKLGTFSTLYDFVKQQNEINGVSSAPTYNGVVRSETCNINDVLNDKGEITYTKVDFILDIDELRYSYAVKFNYIKSGIKVRQYVDLGSVGVSCLRERDMIFPDFGCNKNELIIGTNGSAIDWEIFSVLPHIGDGYTLTYTLSPESVSGYSIVFKYNIPESEFKNGTYENFIKQRRKMAEDYLKESNVDLSDYSLIESKRYW